MKKLILIALLIPVLFGCNNRKKEYDALRVRYDSLLSIGFTKDTAILSYRFLSINYQKTTCQEVEVRREK